MTLACGCPRMCRSDDVPMAGWPSYLLTTVRQPVDEMVARAVGALLRRIGGEGGPEKIRVDGPLVIRRSARVPPG